MAFGEVGGLYVTVSSRDDYITVQLTEPLDNPVIALSGSGYGEPYALRVIDTTTNAQGLTTSFRFSLEEWEYSDGVHTVTEVVNWMAVEPGVHNLPDGRVIEAGFSTGSQTSNSGPINNISFTNNFATQPTILTQVVSDENSSTFETVDTDAVNVTTTGFGITLQEEEGGDRTHGNETVGWIAVEQGGDADTGISTSFNRVTHVDKTVDLGDTMNNSVVLINEQTVNGSDTATANFTTYDQRNLTIKVAEELSGDSEVRHTNETVGVIAFERGLIVCFGQGTLIETINGPCKIEDLREGVLIRTHSPQNNEAGDYAELRHVVKRKFDQNTLRLNPKLYPVRIKKGALGEGLPKRDLLISQQHRMLISSQIAKNMFGRHEVLIPAHQLTKMPRIFIDRKVEYVEYFHLLFDQHEVIYAEGAPSESLYTGEEALATLASSEREELETIFPEIAYTSFTPQPALIVPSPKRQKQLVQRHRKNRRSCLENLKKPKHIAH